MIEVKNLTVKYKRVTALNNINLKIDKGDIVALAGQNGAGKSTLLKSIVPLVEGNVGWMHEKALPDPGLTVYEFLSFLSPEKSDVDHIIEVCGLGVKKNSLCGTLSKGSSRRVILALTLLSQGEFLIFDEPSSGLDPLFQKEMVEIIKRLANGRTIIISTHNISEIEELATRIIVLKDGDISFDGKLDRDRSYYEFF